MPASFSGKMFKTFLGLFFVLSVPSGLYAQENQGAPLSNFVDIDYTAETLEADRNYDKILDIADTKRCVAYNTKTPTLCDVYEDTVTYLYDTQIFTNDEVISKNVERLPNGTFNIYGSDKYYDTGKGWTYTEYGTIEKNDFEALQADKQIGIDEIISKLNPFHIYKVYAQLYSAGGDGAVENTGTNYPSVNSAATGNNAYTANDRYAGQGLTGSTYYITRGLFPFDLSSFGAGTCFATGTLTISGRDNGGYNSGGPGDVVLVALSEMADTGQPSNSDYGKFGNTSLSNNTIALSSWGATNVYYLSQDALADLDPEGFALFGTRSSRDISGTAPTNWTEFYNFKTSEETGTNLDPVLNLTTEDCGTGTTTPPTTGTTTLDELPALPFIDDLTVITGRTDHYESSTTAADWSELHYYRVPAILWWILGSTFLFVLGFMLSQIQRILRKKK